MNYPVFKLVHLLGVLCLFSGIGGMFFAQARFARILHGVGLLIILIGGVMMVYYLGLDGAHGVPLWVKLKMLILVCFGVLPLLARSRGLKGFMLPIALLLGLAASFLGIFKPFT